MTPTFHNYPIPSDRHPEHVNWTRSDGGFGGSWKRGDSAEVYFGAPGVVGYRLGTEHFLAQELGTEHFLVQEWASSPDGMIARLDRESPMPRPPVMVGQVWRFPDGKSVFVLQWNGVPELVFFGELNVRTMRYEQIEHTKEPPPGSDLVWGPFAPWQDTSVKVEK